MITWIFDLDYTLYSLPKTIPFEYKFLHKDPYLRKSLDKLPYKKGIFTNGTREHAYNSVIKMGLENIFDFIEARDSLNGIKPYVNVYLKLIQKQKINTNHKIFFFEDSLENLKVAKKLGWITVFIQGKTTSPLFPRPSYVDFIFKDIYQALDFFNYHLKKQKK